MQEVETRARLVDLDDHGLARRGPIAVLSRSEVEDAIARGDEPARLVLEISRAGGQAGDLTAEARVAVEWEKAELEEVLRASGGDEVTLSFDEGELERLLAEADVEAHGIRERAAVLGIVVAAVAGTAGPASAHPQLSGESTAGATLTSAPSFITDSRGGDGGAVPIPAASTGFVTDSRGGDGGAVPAPAPTTAFVTDSRGGDGGAVPAPAPTTAFVTDSRGGDGGAVPAPAPGTGFVSDSRGGDGGAVPIPAPTTAFVTDSRGGDGGAVSTPAPSGGTSISLPSPGDTAGIAGLALLITAAGFVAVRKSRHPDGGLPA